MSEIKITPDELIEQANKMTALQKRYEGLFSEIKSELNVMNGNWSSLLASNFTGKISSAQKSFNAVTAMLESGAKAALTSAKTFESMDSLLAKNVIKNDLDDDSNVNIKDIIKSQTSENYEQVVNITQWINENWERLPKSQQMLIKGWLKKTKINSDAWEIWSLISEKKYGEGLGKFVENLGSTFDAKEGLINWSGMKIKAVGKTLSLVLKEDSYISQNKNKYETLIENYLMDGDILSATGALTGEFVQTVGKGSADVLCQVTNSLLDSVSGSIPPYISLSTYNQILYESIGTSPGHIFNQATSAINSVVDIITDDVIIGGAESISKALSNASTAIEDVSVAGVKATGSAISSAVSTVGEWMKNDN